MQIDLKSEHGFPILVGVASWLVHHGVLAAGVMSARKACNVKYPALYATKDDQPDDEKRNRFNCTQRGHQNALENIASFYMLLGLAGLRFPVTAAVAGAAYLAGRIVYQKGYASGNPEGRLKSAPLIYGGLFTLLGCTIRFAVQLLRK